MSPSRPSSQYVIAYLLWFVSFALGAVILYLTRETLITAIVVLTSAGEMTTSEKFYQSLRVAAAVPWTFVCMGLVIIVLIVYLENFYRTGVTNGKFWRRFYLVSWIEAAVLMVNHIVMFALRSSFVPITSTAITIVVVEAIITGVFIWLWQRSRKAVPDELRI